MATKLANTGERMIPKHHKGKNIYGAHIARYQAGLPVVKDKVVLDIACGSGYGAKLMSDQAKKVYGVDIDTATIAYAKKNYAAENIVYRLGDATAIPVKDNSIDIVISYETIEHITDYEKFMKEVKRVLKPDGTLLLSTPNDTEYIDNNEFHLHEFTHNEFRSLIGKYFKYHNEYFQTHWLYSSILPDRLQKGEWESKIRTIKTVPLTPEQCTFFLVICSDNEIKYRIESLGVIGEHYRLLDVQVANKKVHEKHQAFVELREQTRGMVSENSRLKGELSELRNSKTWKLAKFFQTITLIIRKPLNLLKKL